MATARTATLQQREFAAMGCQMLAAIDTCDVTPLALVPEWFADWEQCLSRFRPESDLSRLNAAAGRPVAVSAPLWLVLQASLWAARLSDGLVVPTLLPVLEAVGYDRSFATLAARLSDAEIAPPAASAPVADWRAIRCDPHRRIVRLVPGMRLDLGGIAKGWAADRAVRRLSEAGPALVDAGGDIAVSAPPHGAPGWAIGVADPLVPEGQLALLCLPRGGVATSGSDYRRWQRAGRWWHHLLDPRTGLPAETDVLSATVVAPSAREAEVAAKVALLLGQRAGLAWLEARPPLAGLLFGQDGRVVTSKRWAHHLWR